MKKNLTETLNTLACLPTISGELHNIICKAGDLIQNDTIDVDLSLFLLESCMRKAKMPNEEILLRLIFIKQELKDAAGIAD